MLGSRHLTVLAFGAVLSTGGCADLFGCHTPQCAEDASLRAAVRQQINARSSLRFFNIDVQAYDHTVYLYGLVDTELDRGRAEDVAVAVPGVRKVYNELGILGNGLK